jgi:hypothetical protein
MKKRRNSAWIMLCTLLFWWQASSAGAIENWTGLSEVSPPIVITRLNQVAASAPQVYIISPRSEEVIADTNIAVQIQVFGTPIFKNAQLGLGSHVHLLLDRVPIQSIYDLNKPIVLSNLTPGTHTLQVLANKPWHESWKNPQAFAQVTFHVLAKSIETPSPAPQLISVQPLEVGAEPWLLDFYVANAPSHPDPQHPSRQVTDWRVRVTVNEQSFTVNRDEPIYLRGLRLGVNVLKLEYLNAQGQATDSAIRVVKYQPNGMDSLSRLLRNELSVEQSIALFDPQSRSAMVQPQSSIISGTSTDPLAIPNPAMQGNLSTQWNPAMANPSAQWNPAMQQGNPVMQNNPSALWNQPITLTPATPQSTLQQPLEIFPNPAMNAPANSSQPVTSLPPNLAVSPEHQEVAPQNPSLPTAMAKPQTPPLNSIIPDISETITAGGRKVIDPPSLNPINTITPKAVEASAPKELPLNPSVTAIPKTAPNPTADKNETVTELAKKPLASAANEKVVDFQIIWQELLHTTSIKVKQFTNQIPPLVSTWSENFRHWLGDRMTAMRSNTAVQSDQ